jgi:AcrR family transcriptional regulator
VGGAVRVQQGAALDQEQLVGARVDMQRRAEHGWSGTTVAAIAARAQVTPQAVHLAVGGKAALVVRAVEVTVAAATDDEPLADRPAFGDVYAPGIPARRRLEALAAATSGVYGRAARLFLVLAEAAASDATAAELAAQASARRLAGLLAPDASPAQLDLLTDTIWVLAGPAVYVDLVHRRHWPSARYVTWLTDQLDHATRLKEGDRA